MYVWFPADYLDILKILTLPLIGEYLSLVRFSQHIERLRGANLYYGEELIVIFTFHLVRLPNH